MARLQRIFIAFSIITALVGSGSIAQAATIFNDKDSFLDNVQPGFYLESFNSLDQRLELDPPLSLGDSLGHSFEYQASNVGISSLSFYNVGPLGDVWLSTLASNTSIVFDFDLPGSPSNVTAVGGNFFLTNEFEDFIAGTIILTLSDGTFVPLDIIDPTAPGFPPFVGFTTQVPITSLTVAVPVTPDCQANRLLCGFATVNDLYTGVALPIAQVPEPSALALLLAGMTLLVRRKVW